MPRPIHRLSAKSVTAARAGYHADGAGLYLLVTKEGTASWVFRFRKAGRLREMGLGSAQAFTLAEARERAREARKVLADGLDPIEHRRAQRAVIVRTWGEAVEDFIRTNAPGWKNDEQEAQWRQSLTDYGPEATLPVSALDTTLVLRLLRAIWTDKTETATRVRGRIERVWSAEKVHGNVTGENPARWRGHLDQLLPRPSKVARPQHFEAMPYQEVPAFFRTLGERDSRSALALRFTILTAARTAETIGAPWAEFDLPRKLWTIPHERMKGGREHVVPLSAAAVALLEALPRDRPPFALSNGAMLGLLRKPAPKGYAQPFTVHGFRSSFRDWAAETTTHPRDVVEMALAHAIADKTEAAYRRGNLLEKRRALMAEWAAYLAGQSSPNHRQRGEPLA